MVSKFFKKELRNQYIANRKALTTLERTKMSQGIAEHFLSSKFIQLDTYHVFLSIDKFYEIETQYIIQALWDLNKTVVVPKMQGKILLNCSYSTNTTLAKNPWGILEPANCTQVPHQQIDVVLVPMLVCDKQGNRIGYGGGFYDRFLPKLKSDCKFIGINFFEPIDSIEGQEHDIPLDFLITPQGIINFKEL